MCFICEDKHFGNPEAGLNSDGELPHLQNLVDNTRQVHIFILRNSNMNTFLITIIIIFINIIVFNQDCQRFSDFLLSFALLQCKLLFVV